MMKVVEEGIKVYGYRCPFCGRKILTTERLEDLTCKELRGHHGTDQSEASEHKTDRELQIRINEERKEIR